MREKEKAVVGGWGAGREKNTLLFTVSDAWKEVRTERIGKESQMKVFFSELKV